MLAWCDLFCIRGQQLVTLPVDVYAPLIVSGIVDVVWAKIDALFFGRLPLLSLFGSSSTHVSTWSPSCTGKSEQEGLNIPPSVYAPMMAVLETLPLCAVDSKHPDIEIDKR